MLNPGYRLGEALIASGQISEEDLNRALSQQKQTGEKLGESLVNLGILSQSTLVKTLAGKLGVPGTYLRHGLIDPAVARLIDRDEAERLKVLPLFKVRGRLIVAMAEPQNLPTIDRLAGVTGCEIVPILALESNIREFAQKYQTEEVAVDEFLVSLKETDVEVVERESVEDQMVTNLDRMVEGSPIINLVNLALLSAIRDGASDIHIEPDRKKTRIRYRIDGVLRELMSPPAGMHAAIVSRIKVIGKMDIAEKRLPQAHRGRGPRNRPARLVDADDPGREDRAAHPRQERAQHRIRQAGLPAGDARSLPPDAAAPARHRAGHRPHRQRQDDDALLGARPAAHRRTQHHHRRRSTSRSA
jgi:type IV pilus assembly protein PilB